MLAGLKPMGFIQEIIILIAMTVVILKCICILVFTSFPRNPIAKGLAITGKKKGAFSMDLNIKDIKEASKKLGCTVNDFTTAILSNTIHEYFQRHIDQAPENSELESIRVFMPFSLRKQAKRLNDVKINNDFCSMSVELKIIK